MMRQLALVAVCLALAACGSSPVSEPNHYLLRSQTQVSSSEIDGAASYDLVALNVAPYLDQPGLVLETGQGEIHMARHHLWAEPLRLSLPRLLATELGAQLGEPVSVRRGSLAATQIEISIDQLHGTRNGEALLVAYWRAVSPNGETRMGQFADSEALRHDGYPALVEAEQALLESFARSLAAALAAPK